MIERVDGYRIEWAPVPNRGTVYLFTASGREHVLTAQSPEELLVIMGMLAAPGELFFEFDVAMPRLVGPMVVRSREAE